MAYQPAPTQDVAEGLGEGPNSIMAAPVMPGQNPENYPQPELIGMPNPMHQGIPAGGIMGLTTPQIFDALHNGIFVKQKFDVLEIATGCNREKQFYVFDHNPNNLAQNDGIVYFSCKESSSFCARNCMPSWSRPLNMLIYKGFHAANADQQPVLNIQRPCTCTCCCLNRPNMQVTYIENGANEYLGKVVDEFSCCDSIFTIRDPTDKVLFTIDANCCQCGMWCSGPCKSCQRFEFKLWSGNRDRFEGMLVKLGKNSAVKNILSSASNFSMAWPQVTDWKEKALLLASVLLIDFMLFEEKDDQRMAAHG